jgi:hypothetical protein
MRNHVLLSLGLLVATTAHADLGRSPPDRLVRFLLGGVNAGSHKSNFYAGDDSNSRIDDLGAPGRESGLSPLLNADIRYTFADTRTQVFLGNLIQDAVRFDFTQQLGLRQEMGDKGIVATSWCSTHAGEVERSSPPAGPQRHRSHLERGALCLGQDLGQQRLRHPDQPGSGARRGAQRPAI